MDEADPPVTVRQPSPARTRDPVTPLRIYIPNPDVNFISQFPSTTATIRWEKTHFHPMGVLYICVTVYSKSKKLEP